MGIESHHRHVFATSARRNRRKYDTLFVLTNFRDSHFLKLLNNDFPQGDLAWATRVVLRVFDRSRINLNVLKKTLK